MSNSGTSVEGSLGVPPGGVRVLACLSSDGVVHQSAFLSKNRGDSMEAVLSVSGSKSCLPYQHDLLCRVKSIRHHTHEVNAARKSFAMGVVTLPDPLMIADLFDTICQSLYQSSTRVIYSDRNLSATRELIADPDFRAERIRMALAKEWVFW